VALRPTYPDPVTSTALPRPAAASGARSGTRTRIARWTPWLVVANLVAEVGIVLTGGVVRLTGSGLGCPTWPECAPGSYVPVAHQAQGFHKYIEFGNRTLTSVVGVLAIAVIVAVWTMRPARPRLRLVSVLPLVGVAVQAVVGGITVLTHLSPYLVALHFLISMLLITASTVLVVRVGEGDGFARPLVATPLRALARLTAAVTAAVLVLGTVVTGSGPHSGDADAPARFALDPRSVSWLHADLVLLLVGLVVGLLVGLEVVSGPALAVRRCRQVFGVLVAQGFIGYLQYATGLPGVLVGLHMLGACLLVVAVTALLLSLRERAGVPAAARSSLPAAAAPPAR
jgi:cytochrome c oxidase assembly protein subunit 15